MHGHPFPLNCRKYLKTISVWKQSAKLSKMQPLRPLAHRTRKIQNPETPVDYTELLSLANWHFTLKLETIQNVALICKLSPFFIIIDEQIWSWNFAICSFWTFTQLGPFSFTEIGVFTTVDYQISTQALKLRQLNTDININIKQYWFLEQVPLLLCNCSLLAPAIVLKPETSIVWMYVISIAKH